ncbi:hypothetical protein ACHAW6_013400 [Cyclotella cf. meneghiniana]
MATKSTSPSRRSPRLSNKEAIGSSLEKTPLQIRQRATKTCGSRHRTIFFSDNNDYGDNEVVPFLALETPKRNPRNVAWSDLQEAPKLSTKPQQATQQQQTASINKSRVKKRRGISPTAHCRAIVGSLLSSPFDPSFLSSPNKLFSAFVSPRQRSTAEATLFHVTSKRGESHTSGGKNRNSSSLEEGEHGVKGQDIHAPAAASSPTTSPLKQSRASHSPLRRLRAKPHIHSPDLADFKILQRRTNRKINQSSSTAKNAKQTKTENYSHRRGKPFLLYCKANRERVKLENPVVVGAKAINTILFAEFNNLASHETAQWYEQAASHDLTTNNLTTASGDDTKTTDTVTIEPPRRKSCPPKFYHDLVFDKSCSPSNRESPSKFDSPSSFGLITSFDMESNESLSKGADGRSGVSKKRTRPSISKGGDGASSAKKDESAMADDTITNKSLARTKSLVASTTEVHPTESFKDSNESKNGRAEKEKKKRRRGRTQRSSLLSEFVLLDVISSKVFDAPVSPIRATHLPVVTMDGAPNQVIQGEPSDNVKNTTIKSETLSNKEIKEILSKKRKKSAERAKKAAAKKEAAKIAKSSANSTKLDEDGRSNANHGVGDSTDPVAIFAKKAPVQDNLILRLLTEDTDICDKLASGENSAFVSVDEAPPEEWHDRNPILCEGLHESPDVCETKTIVTKLPPVMEAPPQDMPSSVREDVSSLQRENDVSKSSSLKTSPDCPRRNKRHRTSSLEKSSVAASSVSEDSSQASKRRKTEKSETISNKQLGLHLQKMQKQNAERAKKAAAKQEKSMSISMPESASLPTGPMESEHPLTEQKELRNEELSVNPDASIASPESPLRAKRLLSALYEDSPVPIEEDKESASLLSRNLLNVVELTRHSDLSCVAEQNEDVPTEVVPPPIASEVSGAAASMTETRTEESNVLLLIDKQDGDKCFGPSQNESDAIDVNPAASLSHVDIAETEGANTSLHLKPSTAFKGSVSEAVFSDHAMRSEDPAHCSRESGDADSNDLGLDSSTLPVVAEDTSHLITTQHIEKIGTRYSPLPNNAAPRTQSRKNNTNSQPMVTTDSFRDISIARTDHEEKQLRIMLAERQYQEKLAELGRLELETKMMAERMLAIEERVRGIDSLTAFHRVDEFNPPERFESVVSRTYHSEILSSQKRRRFHSPHYCDASVDEYASSHHFSRRRSHSVVREERQSVRNSSPRHRALHTSPKRREKMKIDLSKYREHSSDSSDGEFERSRRSSIKRRQRKEKTRRRRSEDFSESSLVEFEQSHRSAREKSKEKENIRSRQRHVSGDRSRKDFEHLRHGSNSEQKKSSVSRKKIHRVERPRTEKLVQLTESRDRSRVVLEHARHESSSGDNKAPVSRKQRGRSESPRLSTSGQLSESRDRSPVESERPRPNKNIRRKKSSVSRKQLSRAESPRRAKSGQLSVLEDIGTQLEALPRDVESDKPTGQVSFIRQDSPRAKALISKKSAKATSAISEAVEDIEISINDLSNDIIVKPDNTNVDTGNQIQAIKPATQSCWLAGEDTSDSDWDFEGPMILPPPPL